MSAHPPTLPPGDERCLGTLKPYAWPLIPDGDPPQFRAIRDPETGAWAPGANNDSASWHVGCMVTQGRAAEVAYRLFPDEATDGSDCRAEVGREGEPCRACASRNGAWAARVRETRLAMLAAFK